MVVTIGKRIAFLRQKYGWTQKSLADRLAMSRVAISHFEMDLSIPSERSITLMAGIFKLSPFDLVEGTTYPRAKAERLPELTNLYTELELQLALLTNDYAWLCHFNNLSMKRNTMHEILEKWLPRLEEWNLSSFDDRERNILSKMGQILDEIKDQTDHSPL
jgi:transcriptional regulator with XRE-family HTH domain